MQQVPYPSPWSFEGDGQPDVLIIVPHEVEHLDAWAVWLDEQLAGEVATWQDVGSTAMARSLASALRAKGIRVRLILLTVPRAALDLNRPLSRCPTRQGDGTLLGAKAVGAGLTEAFPRLVPPLRELYRRGMRQIRAQIASGPRHIVAVHSMDPVLSTPGRAAGHRASRRPDVCLVSRTVAHGELDAGPNRVRGLLPGGLRGAPSQVELRLAVAFDRLGLVGGLDPYFTARVWPFTLSDRLIAHAFLAAACAKGLATVDVLDAVWADSPDDQLVEQPRLAACVRRYDWATVAELANTRAFHTLTVELSQRLRDRAAEIGAAMATPLAASLS